MPDMSNADTDNVDQDKSSSVTQQESSNDSTSEYSQSVMATDGGLNTRYTVLDYYALTIPLVSGKSFQSLNVHSLLRTLLDFLLSHSLQLKALQKREIRFGDLSIHTIQSIDVLVIKSTLPKTTQYQYNACMRHKLVELCPQFILAMYLFARYHIPDTFGELDLSNDSLKDPQFLDFKLLNGGKKLRPLSYSQQYKASTKILKIMDEFKPINLGKILTSQYNTDPRLGPLTEVALTIKPLASEVERLEVEVLCHFAGFENRDSYVIERDKPEPPKEVVEQIFPFLNNPEGPLLNPDSFYQVLRVLRRVLVQDMVEIKQRFPDNLLCDHPIFNSPAFLKYVGALELRNSDGNTPMTTDTSRSVILEPPHGTPNDYPIESGDEVENNISEADYDDDDAAQRLRLLEKLAKGLHLKQQQLAKELHQFAESHTGRLSEQDKALSNLINITNGLNIILTSRNANTSAYVHQVLNGNLQSLEKVKSLLAQYTTETIRVGEQWKSSVDRSSSLSSRIQGTISKRRKTIASVRSLSPDVKTVKELWDDYKDWEREMASKSLSLIEWSMDQPSDDRALRESRAIIVNFADREARRQNLPVVKILEQLENKLRSVPSFSSFSDLSSGIASGLLSSLE